MRNIGVLCFLGFTLLACNNSGSSYEPLPKEVDFNFHIRPILVQNCYLCHGPDPSSREADLRLDTFEGATAALRDGGFAVTPGSPRNSELINRIQHDRPDEMMPPPETNNILTQREKDLLEKWIKQGANWKPHWSFIPPEVNNDHQDFHIDDFIDESLDLKGLTQTSIANRNTLIRSCLLYTSPSPRDA